MPLKKIKKLFHTPNQFTAIGIIGIVILIVILQSPRPKHRTRFALIPIRVAVEHDIDAAVLFCPGATNGYHQAKDYLAETRIHHKSLWYQRNPDAPRQRHIMLPPHVSVYSYDSSDYLEGGNTGGTIQRVYSFLGHHDDIRSLHTAIQELFKQRPHIKKLLLYGVSRGASTIITTLAHLKTKEIISSFLDNGGSVTLVLESPYASMRDVLEGNMPNWLYLLPSTVATKMMQLWKFPNYDFSQVSPYDCIKNIDTRIPMLFIGSKEDEKIPFFTTVRLYEAAKKAGLPATFLELDQGPHADLINVHDPNFILQRTLHTFYKEQGFPYSLRILAHRENN